MILPYGPLDARDSTKLTIFQTKDLLRDPKGYLIHWPLVWGFCITDAFIFCVIWISLLLADSWVLKVCGVLWAYGIDRAKRFRPAPCYFFGVDMDRYFGGLAFTAPRPFLVWIPVALCDYVQDWRKQALMPEYRALEDRLAEKETQIQQMQVQLDVKEAELDENKVVLAEWRQKVLHKEEEQRDCLSRIVDPVRSPSCMIPGGIVCEDGIDRSLKAGERENVAYTGLLSGWIFAV